MTLFSLADAFLFFSVPVCPHGGGVGLCEYIQHISIFDFICVSASLENRLENNINLISRRIQIEQCILLLNNLIKLAT